MLRRCAFIAFAAVSPLAAQTATPIGQRSGAFEDGFSNVVGIAELPDGRVIVSDVKANLLYIGDLAKGSFAQLGRNGNGPGEYQRVSGLFSTRGDTLHMSDFPSRRVLLIAPSGAIVGTRPFDMSQAPLADEPKVGTRLMGGTRYIDRDGIHYSEIDFLELGKGVLPHGPFIAASDPAKRTFRRVAPIQPWYPEKSTRWRAPFLYGDVWTVSPDGRIARVVPTDYHIEWYRDNQLLAKGPPTPFEKAPVTKADRDAWWALKNSAPAGRGNVGPGVQNTNPPPSGSRPAFQPFTDDDFPAVKPPVVEEFVGRAAIAGMNGELWINRVTPQGVKAPVADVFDAKGNRVRTVALPPHTRVAAAGKTSIYLVRTDDDGLQWVERYPLR